MLKLFCVTGYKSHDGDPIINGHQTREMLLEEAKEFSSSDVARLQVAISRCNAPVEKVYWINSVVEAAREYRETIAALNSDNVEALLTADRRFRFYVLEFDMFLDYWESSIPHYRKIDGTTGDVVAYKKLFADLTHNAYDNRVEYQLLDLIRNQTAHVQSPVNRIHVGVGGNEAYSSRDILLAKCKSGENKKKILRDQPEEINLSPIVDVTEKCLKEIHEALIDFQLDVQMIEELRYIGGFVSFIISKNLLYQPWLIMDMDNVVPAPYHIRDMKAYGYLLERLSKKASEEQVL